MSIYFSINIFVPRHSKINTIHFVSTFMLCYRTKQIDSTLKYTHILYFFFLQEIKQGIYKNQICSNSISQNEAIIGIDEQSVWKGGERGYSHL